MITASSSARLDGDVGATVFMAWMAAVFLGPWLRRPTEQQRDRRSRRAEAGEDPAAARHRESPSG